MRDPAAKHVQHPTTSLYGVKKDSDDIVGDCCLLLYVHAMRSQRTVRKSSASRRGRAALIANSLDLVDEWCAHRRKTGHSINATMAALLDQVDFDRVRRNHLVEALCVLLAGLPTDALADVSNAATAERKILVECVGDREIGVADDQLIANMSSGDRELVRVLEGLWCNPDALRAAVDLIKALGGENVAGVGTEHGVHVGAKPRQATLTTRILGDR